MFFAPQFEQFPSGIYSIEHPKLGQIDLFVQSIHPEGTHPGPHYEVIFN